MSPSAKIIETARLALPEARPKVAAFWEGFASPWTGFQHMRQQPALWRYGLIPFVLNLFITGLLLVTLVTVAVYFVVVVHPKFNDGLLGRLMEVLAAFAALIVAFGLSAIVWIILQGVLCGHFYAKLAEQVELRLGMKREEVHQAAFSNQILDTLGDAGFLAGVNLGLLLLHCVPGIGSIVGAIGSYYFTCMTLGLDYFQHPLALRGKRRSEMRAFARQHRAHTLGLGSAVAVVSLVPIVNAVLLTTVVTGAVLLHRRLDANGKPMSDGESVDVVGTGD